MSLKYAPAVRARITETKWLERQVQHLAVVTPREAALAFSLWTVRRAHGSAVKDYWVRGEAKEKKPGEKGESRGWVETAGSLGSVSARRSCQEKQGLSDAGI